MDSLREPYLRDVLRTFRNYKTLAEKALAQVSDAQLHAALDDAESNTLAIVVKHVGGNLRSRFTDFLTTDGEKPDRNRDTEFEMPERAARDQLMKTWETGWSAALGAIEALTPADLDRTVHIRGEAFLVVEALNRSLGHTSMHVGQIVLLAKHLAGKDWMNLSVPRGRSQGLSGDYKSKGIARQ
ncbi:MAG TPA: DUF1572 family protein [Vicinamibacterales bacterium]|nr:DUF1572 family protein [Vicinamibacterales bacterium]